MTGKYAFDANNICRITPYLQKFLFLQRWFQNIIFHQIQNSLPVFFLCIPVHLWCSINWYVIWYVITGCSDLKKKKKKRELFIEYNSCWNSKLYFKDMVLFLMKNILQPKIPFLFVHLLFKFHYNVSGRDQPNEHFFLTETIKTVINLNSPMPICSISLLRSWGFSMVIAWHL